MIIANDNDSPGWHCVVMYLASQDLVGFATTEKALALTGAEALRLAYGLRSAAYEIVSSPAAPWDWLMNKQKFDNLLEYLQFWIEHGWQIKTLDQFLAGYELIYDEPLLDDEKVA
jgi:hypothetical protein